MRVSIVDDQMLTREGLVRTLTSAGVEVLAAVADVPALMAGLLLDVPDAVVLDVRLPPTFTNEGLVAAEELRRTSPHIAVLVLSQYVEAEFAMRLIRSSDGGVGYLLKDRLLDPAMLVDALQRLVAGQCVLDPSLVADLVTRRTSHGVLEGLTRREIDVLKGIAEGLTNSAIADRLFISDRTVEVHTQRVFDKLGIAEDPSLNKRVAAAVTYLSAIAGSE
jgi:DNA-binding NarL/FixJ family response regulator